MSLTDEIKHRTAEQAVIEAAKKMHEAYNSPADVEPAWLSRVDDAIDVLFDAVIALNACECPPNAPLTAPSCPVHG